MKLITFYKSLIIKRLQNFTSSYQHANSQFYNYFKKNEIFNFFIENSFIAQLFQLRSTIPQEKILLDLHYYAIKFAIENNFSKVQLSSFVSIIRSLHIMNQETPFDNYEQILEYFHKSIICHSVNRPPFCVDIFNGQTVPIVVNYITDTYLRHYKMYKYAFTPIVSI